MRVLVTGFEAYWDYTINSSWEVACKIEKHCMPNVEIIVRQMPVRFASVAKALRRDLFYLKIYFLNKFLNNYGLISSNIGINDILIKKSMNLL